MLQSKRMFGRGLGKRQKRALKSIYLLVESSLNMELRNWGVSGGIAIIFIVVSQYHMWLHLWYWPIMRMHYNQMVPHLHSTCDHSCGIGWRHWYTKISQYHIYTVYVITLVVPADHANILWSAGTTSTLYMWSHIWYRPMTLKYYGRPVPHSRSICDHTCGTGRWHWCTTVGRYHIHVVYVITLVVPADDTDVLWSAGTICTVHSICDHTCGTGRWHWCTVVGRYHMYST
jgi:hypothetical protein